MIKTKLSLLLPQSQLVSLWAWKYGPNIMSCQLLYIVLIVLKIIFMFIRISDFYVRRDIFNNFFYYYFFLYSDSEFYIMLEMNVNLDLVYL